MSLRKNWKIKQTVNNNELIQSCNGSRVLATLLFNRGINTPEKIKNFLNPFKAKISEPDVFKDIDKAFARVKQAVDKNEHITIYGDFDADGVTATALLYLTLKEIGADVDYYLPDRDSESHGLNSKALVQIISKRKSKLIITVDCGISNVNEIKFANGFKTDIIITDHHEAPEILPNAYAILNPKAPDSINSNLDIDEIESLNYLAGVGVAFKFACKILEEYNKNDFIQNIIPLACVGTIGDVVELLGENRSIVATGLELIKKGKHSGITKLLKISEIKDTENVTAETIGFYVVPKINAAGRLDSPYTAIKFLISDNENEIDETVKTLDNLNKKRQELCDNTFAEAEKMYLNDIRNNKKSIILFSKEWHIGIIGIVASKLVEKYNKPTFLMTEDNKTSNIIRCSCRSIQDINIHSVLSEHKELFEGFGGHKMAAGFSFDVNKISFDKFKNLLANTVNEYSKNVDITGVSVNVDMELNTEDITVENVKLIETMQPFGSGNPQPLFAIKNAILKSSRMMGQENNHLKMIITKNNDKQVECVKWNFPDFNVPDNSQLDLLFTMKLNTFNNITNVQLMIEDIHSEFIKQNDMRIKLIDHRSKVNIINSVYDFLINDTKKKTAIFIENPALINKLNFPDVIKDKLFARDNIPSGVEQLMFFDSPVCKEDFDNIVEKTGASLIHFMNFSIIPIETDSFITKLSGMLKYSINNMQGEFTINRIAKALTTSDEAVECALELLDEAEIIDLNKIDDNTCKISYVHPTELSKVKENELYSELCKLNDDVNEFKNAYMNASMEEIKEIISAK